MAFSDTPNKLEAVFVQRKTDNSFYEQINVSGSDIIVYLDSTGVLNADKISVWAAYYGLGGGGGPSVSASWASSSISSSYSISASWAPPVPSDYTTYALSASWASESISSSHAITASYVLNGEGGSGIFASQSLYSTQSIFATSSLSSSWASASLQTIQAVYATQSIQAKYATQSIQAVYATQSIQAIYATQSIQAVYATQSLNATQSLYATSSLIAINSFFASSSISASYAPTVPSDYAISASWASSSLSASYFSGSILFYGNTDGYFPQWIDNTLSATSSLSVLNGSIYINGGTGTVVGTASVAISASWALSSISASYAPSAPSDYSISSSFSSASISSSYYTIAKSIVLCAAYTPTSTGADAAEVTIPFDPSDGTSVITWNVKRLSLRTQTVESDAGGSVIYIEKSAGTGIFSATTVGTVILPSASYESYSGSLTTVNSGDKIRFNVTTLGTSTNWTIITEISNA